MSVDTQPMSQRQMQAFEVEAAAAGAGAAAEPRPGWLGNDRNTLLVVVTLITTLSYQVGVNVPGGVWQDDEGGHKAGQPVLRDKDPVRFYILSVINWLGFYDSLVLTVWLLAGVPMTSKLVRYSFIFCYTCLVFTYNISQPGYSYFVAFAVWVCLAAFSCWVLRRHN